MLYGLLLCYMDCCCVIWTVTVLYVLLLCYMDCYCVIWTVTVLYGLLLCYMDCYCAIWNVTVFYNPSNIFAHARLVKTRHVTQYAPTKIGEYPSDIPQFK